MPMKRVLGAVLIGTGLSTACSLLPVQVPSGTKAVLSAGDHVTGSQSNRLSGPTLRESNDVAVVAENEADIRQEHPLDTITDLTQLNQASPSIAVTSDHGNVSVDFSNQARIWQESGRDSQVATDSQTNEIATMSLTAPKGDASTRVSNQSDIFQQSGRDSSANNRQLTNRFNFPATAGATASSSVTNDLGITQRSGRDGDARGSQEVNFAPTTFFLPSANTVMTGSTVTSKVQETGTIDQKSLKGKE